MRKLFAITAAALALLIPLFIFNSRKQGSNNVASQQISSGSAVQLAALGRVEGRGETISVGAATDGVIKSVLVTDGQQVGKGDLLAVVACDDISAEVEQAKALADSARDARTRLLRGDREEQRAAAAKQTDAAKAVMMQAQDHLNRMNALFEKSEISRDAFDQAKRDFEVAQADYEKAQDDQNLADAEPLPEEVSRADAEVTAAEREVSVASDKLEKCNVRAPISGTVLKVLTKAGESYSTLLPQPLFTITDESVRRVRAEVDERDIGKLKIGQSSIVTADAFPGQEFDGQVVEISDAVQAKSVLGEDPAAEKDRDVLDVLIQLKPGKVDLPIGLRVTARMTGAVSTVSQATPPTSPEALPNTPANSEDAAAGHMNDAVPTAQAAQTSQQTGAPNRMENTLGSGAFFLQAGAMAHVENANALAASLQKKGFPAFVADRKHDPLYRVDVGPYRDLASLTTAKSALSGNGFETVVKHQTTEQTR